MIVVAAVSYVMLVGGQTLLARVGTSGHKVMTRIMGLIVMFIAVEFFFAGLGPIVKKMLAG